MCANMRYAAASSMRAFCSAIENLPRMLCSSLPGRIALCKQLHDLRKRKGTETRLLPTTILEKFSLTEWVAGEKSLLTTGAVWCFCPPPLGEREAVLDVKERAVEIAPCFAPVAVAEARWTEAT